MHETEVQLLASLIIFYVLTHGIWNMSNVLLTCPERRKRGMEFVSKEYLFMNEELAYREIIDGASKSLAFREIIDWTNKSWRLAR
jgi:hypothetical protein